VQDRGDGLRGQLQRAPLALGDEELRPLVELGGQQRDHEEDETHRQKLENDADPARAPVLHSSTQR